MRRGRLQSPCRSTPVSGPAPLLSGRRCRRRAVGWVGIVLSFPRGVRRLRGRKRHAVLRFCVGDLSQPGNAAARQSRLPWTSEDGGRSARPRVLQGRTVLGLDVRRYRRRWTCRRRSAAFSGARSLGGSRPAGGCRVTRFDKGARCRFTSVRRPVAELPNAGTADSGLSRRQARCRPSGTSNPPGFRRSRTRTQRCCAPPGRIRPRSGGSAPPDAGTCPRSRAPESAPAPALPASRPRP